MTTIGSPGVAPAGFCTQVVHTIGWVGFVAGSIDLGIAVEVQPCLSGTSIEMGIYSAPNCSSTELVSNCNTAMFQNNTYFFNNTEPLSPGCVYFLVFDNNGPASCPFTVSVVSGSATAPALTTPPVPEGPTALCPGATATYSIPVQFGSCEYVWNAPAGSLINGMAPPVRIQGEAGASVDITFGSMGGNVCVQTSNPCYQPTPACLPVTVAPIPPTVLPPVSICNGDVFEWIDGNSYSSSQTLSVTLPSWLDCDSTVRQQLTVRPPIVTNLGTLAICQGECVEIGDSEYCGQGFFQATLESYLGCDSMVVFSLLQIPIQAVIASLDTLSCSDSMVVLSATGSTNGATFAWFNSQQQLIGVDSLLNVSNGGQYTLVVTRISGSVTCRDTAMAQVPVNFQPPEVSAEGDTLDCTGGAVQINGESMTPGVLYFWTGPGIDSLNQTLEDPLVAQPGTYILTVSDPLNGCTASDTTLVYANVNAPVVLLSGLDTLNCQTTTLALSVTVDSSNAIITWTGPASFMQSGPAVNVSMPGNYTVSAQASNGCSTTFAFSVLQDTLAPIATASGDTLDCNEPLGSIRGTGADTLMQFHWSGPFGFSVDDSIATVQIPGEYVLTATGLNGCTVSIPVSVTGDFLPPGLTGIAPDTLSCKDTLVVISASSPSPGVLFDWEGPNGFMASGANQQVQFPGNYQVIATGQNGCKDTLLVVAPIDTVSPDLTLQGGLLDCAHATIQLMATSQTPGVQYNWTGPGGFTAGVADPLISTAGPYSVTVTGTNGCTAGDFLTVDADFTTPVLSASASNILNCNDTFAVLSVQSSLAGTSYQWTGPANFSGTGNQELVSMPGNYTVIATAPNGCTGSAQVNVGSDFVSPDIQASGDTLDCSGNGIVVSGSSSTTGVSYFWTGPGGFQSMDAMPVVFVQGSYMLTVTAPNGCTATATAIVWPNLDAPDLNASASNTITCAEPFSSLTALSAEPGVLFAWTGPGGFSGTGNTVQVGQSGVYSVTATAPNGCTISTDVQVNADFMLPDVTASGGLLDCAHPSISISGQSGTNSVLLLWTGPGGFQSGLLKPTVTLAGVYTLTATGPNGCVAADTAVVTSDLTPPVINVSQPDTLTCEVLQTSVFANVVPVSSQIQWTGPGGFTGSGTGIVAVPPGLFRAVATAPNGCRDTVQVTVLQDTLSPSIAVKGDTLNCSMTVGILDGFSATPGVTFLWAGPGGFSSASEDPAVTVPGSYQLVVKGPNGCQASAQAFVVSDTVAPLISANNSVVSCASPQASLQANVQAGNIDFKWSGPAGFTSSAQNILVTNPGNYFVTATGENGCTAVAAATVTADTISPAVELHAGSLTCKDTLAVVRAVVSPAGSALNWSGPQGGLAPVNDIEVAIPGVYSLTATAANGCSTTEMVIVESELPEWTIDLGPDTVVFEDTWITIYLQTDITSQELADISWEPTFGCYNCPRQVFRAEDTTFLSVRVEDVNGCIKEDGVTVFTRPRGSIYVPNVFSPNDDGINDVFRIYPGPGIQSVRYFSVFDRWGAQVFLAEGFFPDEQTGAWDGRFRGERMQPAVFVWIAEVIGADGIMRRYTGDVLLQR